MFISHKREKLINAIIYFSRRTRYCHTLKLFKLLHFLDFEHFRMTGYPSIGLEYVAWPMGPAPIDLANELQRPQPDLAAAISIRTIRDKYTNKIARRDFRPKKSQADLKWFTPLEIKIMHMLVLIFADAESDDMSEFSHGTGLPWHKVYQRGSGENQPIPYEVSLECSGLLNGTEFPSLSREEFEYRRKAFAEIDPFTG